MYELVVCKVCIDLSEFKKYFEVYAWIKILGRGRKKNKINLGQLIWPA
jgi:hypothetical protein